MTLSNEPDIDNPKEIVLFWLDKMTEVTYRQSQKDMHKITAGMAADQILKALYHRLAAEAEVVWQPLDGKNYESFLALDLSKLKAIMEIKEL